MVTSQASLSILTQNDRDCSIFTAACIIDGPQIGNSRQRGISTINSSHILILTSIKTLGILNRQIIQFSKQLLANQTYFFIPRGSLFVKVTLQSHKATVSKFIIMFYCELCSRTVLPSPYIYLLYNKIIKDCSITQEK